MKQLSALSLGVICLIAGLLLLPTAPQRASAQATDAPLLTAPAPGTPGPNQGNASDDLSAVEPPQTDTTSPASAVPELPSVDTTMLQPLDPQLLKEYALSIEAYRTAEKEWRVSKEQWQKVDTLASLEEAVSSTREVLVLRDAVFLKYFQVLVAAVQGSQGLELSIKERLLARIEAARSQVQAHQELSQAAQDRAAVNTQSYAFTALFKELETTSYTTQAYLHMAKLQTLLDQSQLITDAIVTAATAVQLESADQAAFDRSVAQIRQEYQGIQAQISELVVSIEGPRGAASEYTNSSYSNLRQRSSSIYAELRGVPALLSELLGMIP